MLALGTGTGSGGALPWVLALYVAALDLAQALDRAAAQSTCISSALAAAATASRAAAAANAASAARAAAAASLPDVEKRNSSSTGFNLPDVETLFAPVETLVVQGARAPRPRPAPCALPIMRSISPARKMRSFLYCTHARGR